MAPPPKAPSLRLATYNVEWFNALFDDAGHLLADDDLSARYQITRRAQLAALKTVFRALDADGIMVIEAPDTGSRRSSVTALERFAAHAGLRARRCITGFVSETEQEIAFLYDPARLTVTHDPLGQPNGPRGMADRPRFDSSLHYDLDQDGVAETIRFSKPPLELAVTFGAHHLRLIGVHAKSKSAHGVTDPERFRRISIDNRRKQLAECLWLRQRVDMHLDAGDHLIVMGDLNDGPGLDDYEKLFGHSGVEVVLGVDTPPDRRLYDRNAAIALSNRLGLTPTSARFWHGPEQRYFGALLDFIMLSPNLCATAPHWRIWHPQDDPAIAAEPGLADALMTASDHFPVTIDLALD